MATTNKVQEEEVVNGAGVSIALQTDLTTQLASAFMSLDENDQYDAVLTGLCAKILDDDEGSTITSSDQVLPALQDPISLLTEMNQRRIKASPRSLMSLIDVSTW